MAPWDFVSSHFGERLRMSFLYESSCIMLNGNIELFSYCMKVKCMCNGDYEC